MQLLPYPVTANQTAEVYISHSNGPGDFYLQFSSTDDELSRLAELCEVYDGTGSGKYKIDNPQKVFLLVFFKLKPEVIKYSISQYLL